MKDWKAVVSLCQELIRHPSLSGQESPVAGVVEGAMRALGYDSVEVDDCGSVIGTVRGHADGPTVLMDAHMDVVPIDAPEMWRRDPFGGEVDGGRIWGRGATDVKGSLAALVRAVGTLDRSALQGNIIVSAGVAEESAEGYALSWALAERPVDRVVICEPTMLAVGLGHKGRARLIIETAGVAAHSSRPDRGVNAVGRMMPVLARLNALEPRHDSLLGDGLTEVIGIESLPTIPTSTVPHVCRVTLDRRLVRGETPESVMAELRSLLGDLDGITLKLAHVGLELYPGTALFEPEFHPAWAIEPDSVTARLAIEALEHIGQSPTTFYAPYCTNGTRSGGAAGLPTIIYGAGTVEDAHIIDEGLDIEQLIGAFEGYQALAYGLTSVASDAWSVPAQQQPDQHAIVAVPSSFTPASLPALPSRRLVRSHG